MADIYPKFIIETYDQQGDCMILGKCTFHKEMAADLTKIKGGGWWELDRDKSLFTLYGDSYDFGKAKIRDIANCVQRKRVFSNRRMYRNYTVEFTFQYRDESGNIIDLEICDINTLTD